MQQSIKPNWRQVSQVFSRPMLAQLARTGSSDSVRAALVHAGLHGAGRGSISRLLNLSLDGLRANYACEYAYKAAVADRIVFGRHSPRTAGLQVELPVGQSVVDAAVFNGTSTAYEIKTELDTDRRLSTQSIDYLKAFDRVYLVTHPNLIDRYARILDERVGILAMTSKGRLSQVRLAETCTSRLDKGTLFRMLRMEEYCRAIQKIFGEQPKVPNGRIFQHFSKLWNELPIDKAHELAVEAMRSRTTTPAMVEFVTQLPTSLRVLGYATPLSQVQRARLLNALH